MTTKIEFIVQMTCDSCVTAVKKSLAGIDGIKDFDINKETGAVVVESSLKTDKLLSLLESTGRKVRVKGFAGSLAGVSIIEGVDKGIQGVIRFVQVDDETCIIDGTVDGLKAGEHRVHIHECGDLSKGCESVGDIYIPKNFHYDYGDLGTIEANVDGRASFRLSNNNLKLSDVIGRSVVLEDNTKVKCDIKVACGIIARSAGLFQNPKTICACDGVSIWDEVNNSKSSL